MTKPLIRKEYYDRAMADSYLGSAVTAQDTSIRYLDGDEESKKIKPCKFLIDNTGNIHPYNDKMARMPGLYRPYNGEAFVMNETECSYERALRAAVGEYEVNAVKETLKAAYAAQSVTGSTETDDPADTDGAPAVPPIPMAV